MVHPNTGATVEPAVTEDASLTTTQAVLMTLMDRTLLVLRVLVWLALTLHLLCADGGGQMLLPQDQALRVKSMPVR